MSSAPQVPPAEGGPGWWLPPEETRERPPKPLPQGVLDYRTEPVFERHSFDYYVEPRWCVDRLLDRVTFDGPIHDPACGGGTIPMTAAARGYEVTGSDLATTRSYGAGGINFLDDDTPRVNVVSNPPYNLAERFVHQALRVATGRVAMLVRLAFLEGQKRRKSLFLRHRAELVLVCSTRPSMPPGDRPDLTATGGKVAYCWILWSQGYTGKTELDHLP